MARCPASTGIERAPLSGGAQCKGVPQVEGSARGPAASWMHGAKGVGLRSTHGQIIISEVQLLQVDQLAQLRGDRALDLIVMQR